MMMDETLIDDLIYEKAEQYGLDVEAVMVEDDNDNEYVQYRFRGPLGYFDDLVNDKEVFLSGYVVDGESGRLRHDESIEEMRRDFYCPKPQDEDDEDDEYDEDDYFW